MVDIGVCSSLEDATSALHASNGSVPLPFNDPATQAPRTKDSPNPFHPKSANHTARQ